MKVKIGIVICGLEDHKQYVSDAYIQAIKSVGGLPIILPLVKSKTVIEEYVTLCDGFLFCGGDDITPLLFGEEPKAGIGKTDISMDLFQIRLMKAALQKRKTASGNLPWHAGPKRSLRWKHLPGLDRM